MGFEVGGNTAVLEFEEGSALGGAFVRISLDMSVRDFLELQRKVGGTLDEAALIQTYREFGDSVLREWDLVLDGEALPANGEGLLKLPWSISQLLFTVCGEVMAGALSGNSNAASVNGASAVAANGTTAPRSKGRGNLRRLS